MKHTLTQLTARVGLALTLALPAAAGAAPPDEAADEPAEVSSAAVLPAQELTPQILSSLLLAEIAGARGEVEVSSETYLDLARHIKDPRIARRATEIALYARDMDKATEAARIWATADPGSEDARRILATIMAGGGGRLDEVQLHLARILAQSDEHLEANLMGLNRALARVTDKKAVAQMIERLTEPYLDRPAAYFARAQAALLADDQSGAQTAIDAALRLKPDWEPIILLKAQLLEQTQETGEAVSVLRDYVAHQPDNANGHLALARALVADRQYKAARDEFRGLLARSPDNHELMFAVGLLSAQLLDFDDAETQLKRAIAAGHPDADGIRLRLGQIAEHRKAYGDALEYYRAVGEGQYHLDAQVAIARVLAAEGKIAEARGRLHKAGSHADNLARKRLLIAEAQILRDADRTQEAFELMETGLRVAPEDADLLYESAMIADRLGRVDVMEARLRKLIAIAPDNAHARNALGYSLADRGVRLDEAEQLITRALELAPDDPFILDSMGWVRFRRGDLNGALTPLERAYQLRPDPEIAAHLGEVLWSMQRRDDAKRVWDKALKTDPDNTALVDTVRRLSP